MYKETPILDKQSIFDDMEEIFKIYDKIEWLQFVGGELFLHPNMDEILLESKKYSSQFDKIILMTNGGVVPKQSVINSIKEFGENIEVQISDYGPLSKNICQLETVLSNNNISFVTKCFHGDMQHYGGWVDCGGFEDRNYTLEEQKAKFESCWQISMQNLHTYNGKIHNCIRSLFGQDLGFVTTPSDEYIDLRNDNKSLEEKRQIAEKFSTRPLNACKYCSGFDSKNSKRYPAAEQV